MIVSDKGEDTYTWLVNVLDVNRAPLFIHNLTDLTASGSAAITGIAVFADFFRLTSPGNIVFLDPDDGTVNGTGTSTGTMHGTILLHFFLDPDLGPCMFRW